MSLEKSQNQGATVEVLSPFLGRHFLLHYLLPGLLAFLLFEVSFGLLLGFLNLSRSRGFIFLEFLLFASVSGLFFSLTFFMFFFVLTLLFYVLLCCPLSNKLCST